MYNVLFCSFGSIQTIKKRHFHTDKEIAYSNPKQIKIRSDIGSFFCDLDYSLNFI